MKEVVSKVISHRQASGLTIPDLRCRIRFRLKGLGLPAPPTGGFDKGRAGMTFQFILTFEKTSFVSSGIKQ
jgi:hypothetical protein